MLTSYKSALKFVLALSPLAFVAGYSTAIYTWEKLTTENRMLLLSKFPSFTMYLVLMTLQSLSYAIILGSIGYLLAHKIGLIKDFTVQKIGLKITAMIAIVNGFILSLDKSLFGHLSQIAQTYADKPTLATWVASITYGGVIEEIIMRLFLMSLFSLLIWKAFYRHSKTIPNNVLISCNILTALLFAAGHLPATKLMFGDLTPLLIFRSFLLNGISGLGFGYLYRKHGIHYAMLAHAGTHIIWKTIWVLFL